MIIVMAILTPVVLVAMLFPALWLTPMFVWFSRRREIREQRMLDRLNRAGMRVWEDEEL